MNHTPDSSRPTSTQGDETTHPGVTMPAPPFPVVCLIAIQQAAQTHGWDDTDTEDTDT